MTDNNVTRVFSLDEALAFVIERGVIAMPISELGRRSPHGSVGLTCVGRRAVAARALGGCGQLTTELRLDADPWARPRSYLR
jgi:hypothetical protein